MRLSDLGEFQVRLAYEQGLLSRPSLNPVQNWALQYWVYMNRRRELKDSDDELEAFCAVMWPERWQQLYGQAMTNGDMGRAFEGEEEIPVTDPADLDQWFNNIATARGITGAEAEAVMGGSHLLGWAEGEGMRV